MNVKLSLGVTSFFLAVATAASAQSDLRALTEESLAIIRSVTSGDLGSAVAQINRDKTTCSPEFWDPISGMAQRLKAITPVTWQVIESGSGANFYKPALTTARGSAEIVLIHADDALKRGCIDYADKLYRSIMMNFPGEEFAAERQRAQIGIEDVREKRRK